MPITTPETERQFRMYGSSLEAKAAAKASKAMLEAALLHGADMEEELRAELAMAVSHIDRLLESASEAVSRLRPTRIEERGYKVGERVGFRSAAGCGDGDCGGCGSGGNCGGGSCGGCSP
jgi:hypothetical protein